MNSFTKLILGIAILLCLPSCADHVAYTVACAPECHQYGFWGGVWHGTIVLFDLIGMLFWDDVAIYAPNNNGGWYGLGFVLGTYGFIWVVLRVIGAILSAIFGR